MRKYNTAFIFLLSIICIGYIAFKTNAFFTSKDKLTNKISAGDIKIEINENFDPPTNWNGKEHTKNVRIKNTGPSDELVRVAILPRWVDENGNPWPGDSNYVHITFYSDQDESSEGTWMVDKKSNYYYYKKILSKNEETEDLIKNVSIQNLPEDLKSRYKGKTLIVDVKSESVQATKEAYHTLWNDIGNEDIRNQLDKICKS